VYLSGDPSIKERGWPPNDEWASHRLGSAEALVGSVPGVERGEKIAGHVQVSVILSPSMNLIGCGHGRGLSGRELEGVRNGNVMTCG
jgi:hypothetical protein